MWHASRVLKVVIALGASTALLALTACGGDDSGDAMNHARIVKCGGDVPVPQHALHPSYADVEVENQGSGNADYSVVVAQIAPSGNQIESATADFIALEPGQAASERVHLAIGVGGEWSCEIVDLQRTER
jgi:hypothetical protein